MSRAISCAVALTLVLAAAGSAADVPVGAKKLVVVDKTTLVGTAKIVFVAKDAAITKGPGLSIDAIDASFELAYVGAGSVAGSFVIPAGASNGTDGWKVNKATVAKYVNKAAPSGPTGVKVAVVKPGKLLKLVGKSRGDVPIDVVAAGAPPSGVETVYTVTNDAGETRHCSVFPSCVYKLIGGGTGAKLVCKNGVGSACPIGGTTTTTVATTTSTSASTLATTSTSTSTSSSTSSSSTSTSTTTSTAPSCSDFVQNGSETDVDCGGGVCPDCGPGGTCLVNADCTSSVCSAFVCLAASCSDGVQNGGETDVDCGGPCPDCALTKTCSVNGDCISGSCSGGTCKCPASSHTFGITSTTGGLFTGANWQGGTQTMNFTSECSVTMIAPTGNISLVGLLGDSFAVTGSTGFSGCAGTGGEDGDGCQTTSCPFLGIAFCEATRPSCTTSLNGTGTATYSVSCTP